jgi:hypothetical protein
MRAASALPAGSGKLETSAGAAPGAGHGMSGAAGATALAAAATMAREDRQAESAQPWARAGSDEGFGFFGFGEYALAQPPPQRQQQQQASLGAVDAPTAQRKRSLDTAMARDPCEMEAETDDAPGASEPGATFKRDVFAARSGHICYCGTPAQIGCWKMSCASCCTNSYGSCRRHMVR